ncbi:MAG: hydantoinase B/oxoprolinase family protein, partial [Planctomycetes bacterium]|nr:hydantoinase B/oxoprolinase family protein [Planctomycetota bacterium]
MKIDPFEFDIFEGLIKSVCEEMSSILIRSSYSVNIKERKDASCAMFDLKGRLIAQSENIPVHIGSMSFAVIGALKRLGSLNEGDLVILNDPYIGGTHLPDVTVAMPVYYNKKVLFYLAVRAHFADIGGSSSGSIPIALDLTEEGVIIPPLKLYKSGYLQIDVLDLLLANFRDPDLVKADLDSMIAALNHGAVRIRELLQRYGTRIVGYSDKLIRYSALKVTNLIKKIPAGRYTFKDFMDDDGIESENIKIECCLIITGKKMTIDFSRSSPQVKGNINCVLPVTYSACLYVIRTFIFGEVPANSGLLNPINVVAPEGTIVNARFPAACSAGNVETSQRIVDVLYGAFSKCLPDLVPAASGGSMNNVCFGGFNPVNNKRFVYYETIAGGMGATPHKSGESAIHMHMTNTSNTPIEIIEREYPVTLINYS